jgi:predicted alpha/beta hydrolase family esterase
MNIPGLRNSNEHHWQSVWEKAYPDKFLRVIQADWEYPNCADWIAKIEETLKPFNYQDLILIGHSVGCVSIIKWYEKYGHVIKAALFVAPSDVDRPDYPGYITGFNPMPAHKLPFPSLVVASTNDHVVELKRAKLFARNWGSEFVELKDAGHIEPKSGFGKWDYGLELIERLKRVTS